MEDNWKHRSDNMQCKTCMWFMSKESNTDQKHIGRCRKHSPTIEGWPVMFSSDWCGDHKLDETKYRR